MTMNSQKPVPRSMVLLLSLAFLGPVMGTGYATAATKGHAKKSKEKRSRSESDTSSSSSSEPGSLSSAALTTSTTAAPTATSEGLVAASNTTTLAASGSPALKPVSETSASSDAVPGAPASAPANESETPTPPGSDAPAASPVPPGSVFYVEHLGAEAYPGNKRGIYGGSLWLEPSFHGLQWPYMPRTGLGLSGSAWVDTGYEQIIRGHSPMVSADTKEWVQQARAVLRATPTYSDGKFFVQGQMEVVGNSDQIHSQSDAGAGIVDIDDLWLRVGSWNSWDVKVGRYEGWEMYHTGMGLDINTIERRGATQNGFGSATFERPDYYGATYLHDRPSQQAVGNVALHLYPTPFFRVELLGQLGADAVATNSGSNTLGGRPAAILDLGLVKVKVGGEYLKQTHSDSYITSILDMNCNSTQAKSDSKFSIVRKGVGGSLQFVFDPTIEFGVSGGIGWVNSNPTDTGAPSATGTYKTTSVGGFANLGLGSLLSPNLRDLIFGAGVDWTTQTDDNRDNNGKVDYTANLQAFGALQYLVAHQLFVKAVIAYARSDFELAQIGGGGGGTWSNDMWSARLRLMYLF